MSLLGPDRLLVGRSVVDRKEARCIHCMQPIKFGPKGEPGVVHSREGMKEMGISGMCETCFDNLSGEPDDGTFLEFKRSADEDEPCPCAGGTATCRGNCPIFDKVAKQDAAQPSQAPVVQAVQTEVRFKYESMKPIDGYDAIYAEYATTFGRYPDDFMSKVVRQTKEDLFMWWGAHREKIRAGLVLLAAQEDASSGATTQAVRMLTPREIELLREIRLHAQFGLNEGWQREARNLLLELEQYYRTIPPSGVIGGV